MPLDISVANEKDCSGKRSNAPAHKIYCCAIIRSFHSVHFTLSSYPADLSALALRDSKRERYECPMRLSICKAETTVSN